MYTPLKILMCKQRLHTHTHDKMRESQRERERERERESIEYHSFIYNLFWVEQQTRPKCKRIRISILVSKPDRLQRGMGIFFGSAVALQR